MNADDDLAILHRTIVDAGGHANTRACSDAMVRAFIEDEHALDGAQMSAAVLKAAAQVLAVVVSQIPDAAHKIRWSQVCIAQFGVEIGAELASQIVPLMRPPVGNA